VPSRSHRSRRSFGDRRPAARIYRRTRPSLPRNRRDRSQPARR
jgi:hypothetical protein